MDRRRPSRWATVFWWVVLLICVGLLYQMQRDHRVSGPDDWHVPVQPDVEQIWIGRLAVAASQFDDHFGSRLGAEMLDGFAEGVGPATTAPDIEKVTWWAAAQIRLAIAEAEVFGFEPARQRLGDLLDTLNSQHSADGRHRQAWGQIEHEARGLMALYGDAAVGEQMHADDWHWLIARHGWFGRLALTHEPNPPADAVVVTRDAVIGEAMRTLAAMGGFLLLGLVAGAAGLVLAIVALVLLALGRIRRRYRQPVITSTAYLEATAMFLLVFLVTNTVLAGVIERTGLPLGLLAPLLMAMVVFWPLLRGQRWSRWRTAMGFGRGAGMWREAGWGVVGYVAGLPIVLTGLILSIILAGLFAADPHHPVQDELILGGPVQVLLMFLLAVVWAPVVEEAIFRGAFYHHLRGWWGVVAAALISGVIFAAIHPQGLAFVPALTALAVVFALVREWRGSIVGPVAAHALHNLTLVTAALLMFR